MCSGESSATVSRLCFQLSQVCPGIANIRCRKPKYVITGIAGKKGFCSINIEKSMMNSEVGFGRKVLQVFEDQGISFEHVPSGIDTMTIYVHQDEFEEKEQQVIAGIHRAVQPDFVEPSSLTAKEGSGVGRRDSNR